MAEINFDALDLNLLRVFDALYLEGSTTRAGERLNLSQSAISHALGRLRHILKDELFVRSAAGMTPTEYRRLCQTDPIAEYAEQKGRADGEREMATTLYTAARDGDSKAATEMLRYAFKWTAPQSIQVEVNQKISITAALEQAQQRVIDMTATEVLPRADDTV